MKKKINYQLIAIIVVAVILIVVIWKRSKSGRKDSAIEQEIAAPESTPAPTSSKKTLPTLGNDAVLKSGVSAREVSWLQYYYNKMVATPQKKTKLVQDGKFGPKTTAAVKSILGKESTSWTEWKQTLDHLKNVSTAGSTTAAATTQADSSWAGASLSAPLQIASVLGTVL